MDEERNPFQDVPTKYERWLNDQHEAMMQAVGGAFFALKKLEQRIEAHEAAHSAANRAAMDMPATVKDEKPN